VGIKNAYLIETIVHNVEIHFECNTSEKYVRRFSCNNMNLSDENENNRKIVFTFRIIPT
jgi:hypothetical protein